MSVVKKEKITGIGLRPENLHKIIMQDKMHRLVGEHKKAVKRVASKTLTSRLMRKINDTASYLEAMSMDWDE